MSVPTTLYLALTLVSLSSAFIYNWQQPVFDKQLSFVKTSDAQLRASGEAKESVFEQKLDHYNPLDATTWQQKYWERNEFADPRAIFVMLDNEFIAPSGINQGLMVDLADRYNAAMYYLQCRFYGDQKPTGDVSVESLKYLSTEQMLGDVAFFLEKVRGDFPGRKVVLFGTSYGGALATWARMKLPNLVDGAVASSAAVMAEVDFSSYMFGVTKALNSTDEKCIADIREATDEITRMMQTPNGPEELKELFNLCTPLDPNNTMDVAIFFETFANTYGVSIKYARTLDEIKQGCALVTDEANGATALERYANLARMFFASQDGCFQYSYTDYVVDIMGNSSWIGPTASGARPWFYQMCTEFGRFRTSSDEIQPFGDYFKVDVFTNACADIFDSRFTPAVIEAAVHQFNLLYGGMTPHVTNVVFTHGNMDPERFLQVKHDLSPEATAIDIKGATHGWDLRPALLDDSQELKDAREQINQTVRKWLLSAEE